MVLHFEIGGARCQASSILQISQISCITILRFTYPVLLIDVEVWHVIIILIDFIAIWGA